jgi:hypothetical protein
VGNNLDPSIYEAAHVKIKKLVKSLTTRKLRRLLLPLPNLKSPIVTFLRTALPVSHFASRNLRNLFRCFSVGEFDRGRVRSWGPHRLFSVVNGPPNRPASCTERVRSKYKSPTAVAGENALIFVAMHALFDRRGPPPDRRYKIARRIFFPYSFFCVHRRRKRDVELAELRPTPLTPLNALIGHDSSVTHRIYILGVVDTRSLLGAIALSPA